MAGAVIAALPTALIYLLLGRYFVQGLLAGSVRGRKEECWCQPGTDRRKPFRMPSALLAGQTAIVTGAARGIGRAIATSGSRGGCRCGCLRSGRSGGEERRAEIEALGRDALAVRADVGRAAERRALMARTRTLGPVDILVNNAGIMHVIDAFAVTEADWDRVWTLTPRRSSSSVRLVLPNMMERRRGTIVNIASIAGKTANQPVAWPTTFRKRPSSP